MLVDGTKLNGPNELRGALVKYSQTFVRVATEKLLIYALGRGVEPYDKPAVRAIARKAARNNPPPYRFAPPKAHCGPR